MNGDSQGFKDLFFEMARAINKVPDKAWEQYLAKRNGKSIMGNEAIERKRVESGR